MVNLQHPFTVSELRSMAISKKFNFKNKVTVDCYFPNEGKFLRIALPIKLAFRVNFPFWHFDMSSSYPK